MNATDPVNETDDDSRTLTGRDRRRLAGQGQRLKAKVMVGRGGATDAVVEEIRRALTHTELLKVRIEADTAAETDALANELASRVPCHLIRRVGRVALLYRPLQDLRHARDQGRGKQR
jgi:RNA-binding protein